MENFNMPGLMPDKKKEEEGMTRRGFLKKALKVGGAILGAGVAGKGIYELAKHTEGDMDGENSIEEAKEGVKKTEIHNKAMREYMEANEYETYVTYDNWLRHHREESKEKKEEAQKYFKESEKNQ
jgi:hypothetical protein